MLKATLHILAKLGFNDKYQLGLFEFVSVFGSLFRCLDPSFSVWVPVSVYGFLVSIIRFLVKCLGLYFSV